MSVPRIFLRILTALFVVVLAGVVVCSIYIRLNGRQMVIDELSRFFGRPVAMNDVHFLFPFGLRMSDLQVEGVLKVKDLQVQMGIPDLFHKRLRLLFMSLTDPVVVIQRTKDSQFVFGNEPLSMLETPERTADIPEEIKVQGIKIKSSRPLSFLVDYLVVERGQVHFADYTRERNLHVTFKDIVLKAQQLIIPFQPQPMKTDFDIAASFFKEDFPFSGSRLQTSGWANFYHRDMSAKLKITEPQGKLNLSAQLSSKNNDMAVNGKIEVKNWSLPKDVDSKSSSFEGIIFSALQSSGFDVSADFHFETRMDDFQIDSISFTGNVGYNQPSPPT